MDSRPARVSADTKTSEEEDTTPQPVSRPHQRQHSAGQRSVDRGEFSSFTPTVSPRASGVRSNLRPGVAQTTIRAVTPEQGEISFDGSRPNAAMFLPGSLRTLSPTASPRSIPMGQSAEDGRESATSSTLGQPGESRRQGMVFNDAVASSFDSTSSSPPPRLSPFRTRTHTLDGAVRQSNPGDNRNRVNSFSSTGSLPMTEDWRTQQLQPPESLGYPSVVPNRSSDLQPAPAGLFKEKKTSSRRLIKRTSSRQTSPMRSATPSVDSLPLPIPTDDANKVLLLMKTLCGRMRGRVEYQFEPEGPWYAGLCYIEDEKGSLMFDTGDNGPFHMTILPDLRGCRVLPLNWEDRERRTLELVSPQVGVQILLRPLIMEEFDRWLAALLCWQQLRPNSNQQSNGKQAPPTSMPRPFMRRRGSALSAHNASIIKVGKVMLWDKGIATSPRAIVKRPSTRDLRTSASSWRIVSCLLQDNGELKLHTENDVTLLSVIDLTQLSRCAIQQLERSVLDEEYCLAILPIYASTSTQLSIFRPIYLALESRVLFEVWFVLLRAFAAPELYQFDPKIADQLSEVTELLGNSTGEMFRVEKTVGLKVTEAKFRVRGQQGDNVSQERSSSKKELDPLVGNYLAEVVLDGEVRARTTTIPDTKTPFWREEYNFGDIPSSSSPFVSVVVKRVEGNWESLSHQAQASLGLPRTGNLVEAVVGTVDIPLAQFERAKDHEQWLPIYDEQQQSLGTMLVKIHHEELAVLTSSEYQPLSELLHKFSNGLTTQLPDAIPGGLRRIAEILLNIFQVSGSANEWLMNLVEDEIDGAGSQAASKASRFNKRLKSNDSVDSASDREQVVRDMGKSLAGEANLLFRGNSLLTQALEFHMRRLGKDYLEETLAEKIFEINEINPDCEVDPARIGHQDDMQKHWTQLLGLTTEIWECIMATASKIPPELRHILKFVRGTAEDRFGNFLRTVTYTSVSGFLFLRFICPAILNPKLFGLLRDHPRPRAQRTLTLVAKGLQALANLSTIGKKETWMEPMNRFINVQRQPLKDFLDHVCAIPHERASYVLPASYSTPITILGRLSPLAREGFPSLPYLIDHARNFAALVKLWTDSHGPGSANSKNGKKETGPLEGDIAEFAALCTSLQQRTNECLVRLEAFRAAEYASQPTDDLSDAMDHLTFLDSASGHGNYQPSSAAWLEYGDGGPRPPGSSGSEMDLQGGFGGSYGSGRGMVRPEATPLRHVSMGSSEMSSQSQSASKAGTARSLRVSNGGGSGSTNGPNNGSGSISNGAKSTRKFLGGLMRRTASPESSSAGGSSRNGNNQSPSPNFANMSIRERAKEVQRSIAAAEQMARSASEGSGKGPPSRHKNL